MSESSAVRTRPGFIVVGILLAVIMLALLLWIRSGPAALPIDELAKQLRQGTPTQRATAAEGLGKLGNPQAVDPLTAALKDKEWTVRRAAAASLCELGDGRALGPLTEALGDENAWVRIAATQGLAKIGDKSSIKAIEKMVKQEKARPKKKKNPQVLATAEKAIAELKSR